MRAVCPGKYEQGESEPSISNSPEGSSCVNSLTVRLSAKRHRHLNLRATGEFGLLPDCWQQCRLILLTPAIDSRIPLNERIG